jgi:hypothetical protein
MINMMNDAAFGKYAMLTAVESAPYATYEYSNGTLFVKGCTFHEASKIQSAFRCNGIYVIVTPGEEYSFDFV